MIDLFKPGCSDTTIESHTPFCRLQDTIPPSAFNCPLWISLQREFRNIHQYLPKASTINDFEVISFVLSFPFSSDDLAACYVDLLMPDMNRLGTELFWLLNGKVLIILSYMCPLENFMHI